MLVGVLTGTSLHYVSAFIKSVLNLERPSEEQRGRTLASNSVVKQQRSEQRNPSPKLKHYSTFEIRSNTLIGEAKYWEALIEKGGSGGRTVQNTILEEDSTEDGF